MKTTISFSIIIPTYNRLNELKNCLESLKNQTYRNFEVIIIDDNSSEIVSENIYTANFSFRISIHRNQKNVGAAASRNIGIDNAQYIWIAFLDDDDTWIPDKLSILSTTIANNPEVDFIYHNSQIVMENEKTSYITKRESPNNYFERLLVKNIIGGTSMVAIKKTLFEKHGKFDESLRSIEDYELWLRLSKYFVPKYINNPMTLYLYKTGRKSLNKDIESNIISMNYINEKYKDDLKNLSKKQIKEKHEYEFSSLAHKLLLNYNRIQSSKYYFKAFILFFNLRFLFASVLSLVCPRLLFKLR